MVTLIHTELGEYVVEQFGQFLCRILLIILLQLIYGDGYDFDLYTFWTQIGISNALSEKPNFFETF